MPNKERGTKNQELSDLVIPFSLSSPALPPYVLAHVDAPFRWQSWPAPPATRTHGRGDFAPRRTRGRFGAGAEQGLDGRLRGARDQSRARRALHLEHVQGGHRKTRLGSQAAQ